MTPKKPTRAARMEIATYSLLDLPIKELLLRMITRELLKGATIDQLFKWLSSAYPQAKESDVMELIRTSMSRWAQRPEYLKPYIWHRSINI